MEKALQDYALEAEKAFSSKIDFSDNTPLAKTIRKVFESLDKFRIGPALLSFLVVFSFPQERRENLWQTIKQAVREKRN